MASPPNVPRTSPSSIPSPETMTDEEFDDLPLSLTLHMTRGGNAQIALPPPSPSNTEKVPKNNATDLSTGEACSPVRSCHTITPTPSSAPLHFTYLGRHQCSVHNHMSISENDVKELMYPERTTTLSPPRIQLPSIFPMYESRTATRHMSPWSIDHYEEHADGGYSTMNRHPTTLQSHRDTMADFDAKLAEDEDDTDATSTMSREQLRRHKNRLSAARSRKRYQAKMEYLEKLVKELIHHNDELHQTVQDLSVRLQTYQRVVENKPRHFTREDVSVRHLYDNTRRYFPYNYAQRRNYGPA